MGFTLKASIGIRYLTFGAIVFAKTCSSEVCPERADAPQTALVEVFYPFARKMGENLAAGM
jgi:hypothetical protein